MRLHHLVCDRLYKIYSQAVLIAEDEAKCKLERKESTAIALRLKAHSMYPEVSSISEPLGQEKSIISFSSLFSKNLMRLGGFLFSFLLAIFLRNRGKFPNFD